MKSFGDDIAARGRPSLVQPFEKQLFQRFEDLEKKVEDKITDIEEKIESLVEQEQKEEEERLLAAVKQLEEDKLKQTRIETVEEEIILPDTVRVVESAPREIVEDVPVNVELVTQEESMNEGDEMWIMRRQTESSVRHYAEVKFTVTSTSTTTRTTSKGESGLVLLSLLVLEV